jgi:hypothetical protein
MKKEYIIFENDKVQIWRVYKRLYKRPGQAPYKTKFVNLSFFKEHPTFTIQHVEFRERYTKSTPVFFDLKTLNGRRAGRNNTNAVLNTLQLSTTTNTKINRLLKPYFPSFKIGKDFVDNVIDFHFPNKFDCPKHALYACRPFMTNVNTFKDVVYKACKYKGKGIISKLMSDDSVPSHMASSQRFERLRTMYANKGFWSHGEINDFLSGGSCYIHNRTVYRKILRNKEILKKPLLILPNIYYVNDSIRMYAVLLESDIDPNEHLKTNWQDTHDSLNRAVHKANTKKIEYKEWLPKIEDEWTLRTPTDSHELIDWGRDMRNCIGGYKDAHKTGQQIVVGAFKNNDLQMVMALTKDGNNSYSLDELKESCNQVPPQEVTDRIVEIFNRNKIKVVDNDPRQTFGAI